MDPLTICATVAGLAKTCGTAVTTCSGLLSKYKNAPEILASIRTECTTIKITLSYVDWLVKRDTELLSSQLKAHAPLAETFDVALTGCAFTFSLLDIELQKLYDRGKDHDGYKWKDKMRYVWDEDRAKNILDHMRGLQSAVNLVLAALQTSSISALVSLLQDQKPVIERVRQDTRSIRKSRSLQLDLTADVDRQASSENYSIFNSSIGDEDFSFDDEIINSFAYRNAIKSLASKAKATQQNAKPDERHILDEPLIDFEELSQTHNESRINSTAISNYHSLTPTKTFTHTALLSDAVMEDLKSLLPTSIGSPSQQINETHAGFASPPYVSGSPNNALANQRDQNRDVGKVKGQRVSDVSNEQLIEDVKSRRRRSSKEQKEKEVISDAESSLLTTYQLSPRRESNDQYSFRSETSKSSININPGLLETVENAIRRLIIPELETLKQEQKMQQSRQKFDRDSRGSVNPGRSSSHIDLTRKLSQLARASDVSKKPKEFLNRDEQNTDILLSDDSIKNRKESRRDRHCDSSSERRSERNMSKKTAICDTEKSSLKRSKEYRLRNTVAETIAGGILTAPALNHRDMKHNDSRSTIEREKRRRRRSKGSQIRIASIAESTEEIFIKHDVPSMPMRSDIHSSDATRGSVLSEQTQTDVTLSPSEERIYTAETCYRHSPPDLK